MQVSILAFLRSGFCERDNEITYDDDLWISIVNADIILLWFWEGRDVEGILDIILTFWSKDFLT